MIEPQPIYARMTSRTAALLSAIFALIFSAALFAQESRTLPATPFRVGERLTYNISFERYTDVGFAEMYVVSRGKLGESDAVELRSRVKTTGLLSASFYAVDETRTTFASAESGTPLYIRRADNGGVIPKESVSNYLTSPASGLDLLTLIYKARQQGGSGVFILLEKERTYSVTLLPQGAEKVKTDAGEFDTIISNVQSDYLTELGLQNLRINFSSDEAHVPVQVRFKTAKGELRILLAGLQVVQPEADTVPTPVPIRTPRPAATPTPLATPTPFLLNEPLAPELGFALGEILSYRISVGGRTLADMALEAKERKAFMDEDSLLLTGTITSAEQGNGLFSPGDSIRVQVNAETLAPRELVIRLSGPLTSLNQTTQFDQRVGAITTSGTNRVDVPIGTHSILSLIYAIRSFNLKPSKDPNNHVNDTRVAVLWDGHAYIFTLRPSEASMLTLKGEKVSAQLIGVNTGVQQLDNLGIKIWLSTDDRRVPLRFTVGAYQADLITETKTQFR